jgi:hypothetical protein
MKPFTFHFEGRQALSISSKEAAMVEAKLLIEGADPEMIGKTMATFASNYLNNRKDPVMASILIMAYWEFRRLNPHLKLDDEKLLAGNMLEIKPDSINFKKE